MKDSLALNLLSLSSFLLVTFSFLELSPPLLAATIGSFFFVPFSITLGTGSLAIVSSTFSSDVSSPFTKSFFIVISLIPSFPSCATFVFPSCKFLLLLVTSSKGTLSSSTSRTSSSLTISILSLSFSSASSPGVTTSFSDSLISSSSSTSLTLVCTDFICAFISPMLIVYSLGVFIIIFMLFSNGSSKSKFIYVPSSNKISSDFSRFSMVLSY